jgi:hypothetical protein
MDPQTTPSPTLPPGATLLRSPGQGDPAGIKLPPGAKLVRSPAQQPTQGATPAAPSQPTSDFKGFKGSGGALVTDAQRRAGLVFDPGIDYTSGADNLMAKWAVQRADNPTEAKNGLEQIYGSGNAGQDTSGRWWVRQNGQKVDVFGSKNRVSSEIQKELFGTLAESPGTAGATVGAEAGAAFAPETFGLSLLIGPPVGYVLGKGSDELVKKYQGILAKTPQQEMDTLNSGAILNEVFSYGGPAVKQFLKPLGVMLSRRFLGATDEGAKMAMRLLESGARPPVASIAPKGRVFQYDQMLRNVLKGNPQEGRNTAYIQNRVRNLLVSEGLPEEKIHETMAEIADKAAAITPASVGKLIADKVQAHYTGLIKQAEDQMSIAKGLVAKQEKLFRAAASAPGALSADVAGAIGSTRKAVARAFQPAYEMLDKMTQGAAIVPNWPVKARVNEIVKFMAPQNVPAIFNRIAKDDRMYLSILEAQNLRSELAQHSVSRNLTPGIDEHMFGEVADSVTHGFRLAEGQAKKMAVDHSISVRLTGQWVKGTDAAAPYVRALQALPKINQAYGEAVQPFKDAVINKLVTNMKAGIPPDPRVTADLIAQEGYSARTKAILNMMPPELHKQVAAADMGNLLREAAKRGGAGPIRGDALESVITDRGPELMHAIYKPVWGHDFISRLSKYARELGAVDGKITLEELAHGDVATALERRVNATKAADEFTKQHFLGVLTSRDPALVDRAYHVVVEPKGEERLKEAARFFGENSKEMAAIRSYWLKTLLTKAIVEMPSRAKTIAGTAIDDELSKYTRAQQELLAPNGLADDLRMIAKEARFLFPYVTTAGKTDIGVSLAGAQILAHVPFNRRADMNYLKRVFFGWLADRPTTIKAMAAGFRVKQLKEQLRGIVHVIAQTAANEQLAGPGSGLAAPQGGGQ